MIRTIGKNLAATLPIAIAFAIWIAIADSLQVFITSSKLLESIPRICLILTYAWGTSLLLTIPSLMFLSFFVSLLDPMGKIERVGHIGRVVGVVIFLTVLAIGMIPLRKGGFDHLLDPRAGLPLFGSAFIGYLIARMTGAYIRPSYDSENWQKSLGAHVSLAAGVSVFVFGSCHWTFVYFDDTIAASGFIPFTAEAALIYIAHLVLAIIVFFIIRKLTRSFTKSPIIGFLALFAVFTFLPLVMFLRVPAQPDPDAHNPEPGSRGRNVILISVDTLRYDRLHINDNPNIQTPNIDAFASESVIFDRCFTHMPVTIPTHASMLTGLTPRNNDLVSQIKPLDDEHYTIAEHLSKEGFTSAGFISMLLLDRQTSNFDQGFHFYDDFWLRGDGANLFPTAVKYLAGRKLLRTFTGKPASEPEIYKRRAEDTIGSMVDWLDLVKDEDFFGFLHLFDPHWDYDAPEPYKLMYDPDYSSDLEFNYDLRKNVISRKLPLSEEDLDHLIARYDGEVTYMDNELGRLFDKLKELGLWDETMIILTADHGESLEHDYFFGHGLRVYQSSIHVPFIIKPFGGASGERLDTICSNTDIFSTISDALNIESDLNLDSKSLVPFIDGSDENYLAHEYIFSETYPYGTGRDDIGMLYSVLRGDHKLIYSPTGMPYHPTWQLFDIKTDPGELEDISALLPEITDELSALLLPWVEESKEFQKLRMDRQERERLEALQYLN